MVCRDETEINSRVRAAVTTLVDFVARRGTLHANATATGLFRSTVPVGDVVRKDTGRAAALNQTRPGMVVTVVVAVAVVGVVLKATTPRISNRDAPRLVTVADR